MLLETSIDQKITKSRAQKSSEQTSSIINWLRDYATKRIDSRLIDERRCIPPHIVLDFGNQHLFGLLLPERYEGLSLTYIDTIQIIEQLAAIDLTLASFIVNATQSSHLIAHYGTSLIRHETLSRLALGREIAALALTESEAGSNLRAITTQAIPHGQDQWLLNGTKRWIGSAAWASLICVFAKIESKKESNIQNGQITGFAVRQNTPGVTQGPEAITMGLRGMVQNYIYLKNVIVDKSQVLGEENKGTDVVQNSLQLGRLLIGAMCIGGMKRCIQIMHRYAERRNIMTGKLSKNPLTLHRTYEMIRMIEVSEDFMNMMAQWMDDERPIPEVLFLICKTSLSEFLWKSLDYCVQMLGGRGYTESNPISQMFRDARVFRIGEGATEMTNMYVGNAVCNNYNHIETFMISTLVAPTVSDKLKELVEYAKKCFPQIIQLHDSPMNAWYWIYSLIGEVTNEAILLAICLHKSQQKKNVISQQLNVLWMTENFNRSTKNAMDKLKHRPSPINTQEMTHIISGYKASIGDLEQWRPGEDEALDNLLHVLWEEK